MISIKESLELEISKRWLELNERFSREAIGEWDRLYDSGEGKVLCFPEFIMQKKAQLWNEFSSRN